MQSSLSPLGDEALISIVAFARLAGKLLDN
jgi:hypothetical protein